MPKHTLTILFLLAVLLSGGCAVDPSGFPGLASFEVEPQYFCPGEPVTINWDLTPMERTEENCEALGEAYASPVPCTISAACPGSGDTCLDGVCCPADLFADNARACPDESGCYPPYSLTITADTVTLTPPVEDSTTLVGSRTVRPPETTTFSADLDYGEENYSPTRTAEMVRLTPPVSEEFRFPFICRGSTPAWLTVNLDAPRFAGDNVRIVNVVNRSENIIQVTASEVGGPVTLRPGEPTMELNGHPRGVWSASLSPLDPASLVIPRCEATNITDPWPNLMVEVTLECADPSDE